MFRDARIESVRRQNVGAFEQSESRLMHNQVQIA
jgi:hypothetical protein